MHPIAFQFGQLTITWYGIMIAVAFLAGLWTASRRGLLDSVAAEKILDLGPWLIVGGVVGARVHYVLTFWREQFAGQPLEAFAVWRGGLVFYGGLIGASLACGLYARLKKIPLWKLADILAPSIALGHVFGRLGCLLNGCCYGRECHLPWAITFPQTSSVESGRAPPGIPLHPTQIYESGLNLIFYVGLAWLYRHKKFEGQVFANYLVGYAILRSVVETFRGDYSPDQRCLGGQVTPAQVVSAFILVVGLLLLFLLPRFREKKATVAHEV